MQLTDLLNYDTVILYGMGFHGKSIMNRIQRFVQNIVCWDKEQGEYNGNMVTVPPADFGFLSTYGKYLIIITSGTAKHIEEMVNNIPSGSNVVTLWSFAEYEDGFHTGCDGFVIEKGYCSSCDSDVAFENHRNIADLKGYGLLPYSMLICANCRSIERELDTIDALNVFFPDWREKTVYEPSPNLWRIKAMQSLLERSGGGHRYIYSHLYENVPLGEYNGEARCENLEKLTFANESIDYVITTDVFEHVNNPLMAFAEIGRVLRKGGAHIFTVPFFEKAKTKFRVKERSMKLLYLDKPQYHGNPISADGSLVTVDWGYDMGKYIWEASGMKTHEYTCCNWSARRKVFVSVKAK